MKHLIKTKRWNDPARSDDGWRLLVSRYRPRGVRKEEETWDAWWKELSPSEELHDDYSGKHGAPISLLEYQRRYLIEMVKQAPKIQELADRVKKGRPITLLCSSACVEPDRCHHLLLRELIEDRAGSKVPAR
jgi:uncharacterized protein YeaO (DUF488 family)